MSRWVHDAGNCQAGCVYCAEDSRGARLPTPEERTEILRGIHEGQARIPRPATKSRPLTDTESAAIARAKIDKARKS